MNDLELLSRNQQIQNEVESGHAGPALVIGHIEKSLDRLVDSTGGMAVDLDHIAEKPIGEAAFSLELDSLHEGLDPVEVLGDCELVDEYGVEGFIGIVVFA